MQIWKLGHACARVGRPGGDPGDVGRCAERDDAALVTPGSAPSTSGMCVECSADGDLLFLGVVPGGSAYPCPGAERGHRTVRPEGERAPRPVERSERIHRPSPVYTQSL